MNEKWWAWDEEYPEESVIVIEAPSRDEATTRAAELLETEEEYIHVLRAHTYEALTKVEP